ncbi:FAD/NAD(P)-binding protein [Streptomyces inhibens]|uniref:FAD/NAD(P)-binding protein n=1 Tax=Streptomyces inhibens TaxID=2293571 RepID=UPI001EE742C9|nr:FAD/NAD(P)-binding protein [Streptomyces inhibens]UKY53535.1 FAD/NAD(P)-binding protein [Streptomyces inhibens]
MSEGTLHVAVVGAGAAGTLASARLLDAAVRTGHRLRIDLIDPAPETGRGVAYATPDPRHLLNVPAGRMSALSGDGDDFVRWLADQEHRRVDPAEYVPRDRYGAYLADDLHRSAAAGAGTATVRRRHDRVVAIARRPVSGSNDAVHLRLRTGETLDADVVVLALGHIAPGSKWLPDGLQDASHFVADPWQPGALADVPDDQDVLLVGTGLTMCDIANSLVRPGRTVHAVSRHGLLPLPHAAAAAPATAVRQVPVVELRDLAQLKRGVQHRAALCRRRYGDWRPAVDELRPHIALLWQQLSFQDRERFLAGDLREWEVHRHRMPPATDRALAAARLVGLLTVQAAEVSTARTSEDGLGVGVRLSNGWAAEVGAVINCTGTEGRVRELTDPFVRSLLHSGIAAPGPHGLGFDTAPDGRLTAADGSTAAPVWTLGQLRRGNLWETTAIPEIRVQATELAARILDLARAPALT